VLRIEQIAKPNQPHNRHHIGARSRWKAKAQSPKVTLPECYHEGWHALFGNMTPYEATLFVEVVMNERTRLGWDKERLLSVRCSIIRCTEDLRQRRRIDPLEQRPVKRDAPIRFDHVPGWWRELHEFLFGDLRSVAEIQAFITELMLPNAKFDVARIVALQEEVKRRHGLRVV